MIDKDLTFLYNILKGLERDLLLQETYSERVDVRQEIQVTKKEIDKLKQKMNE